MTERKRRGLGRGLGALINSDSQEAEASGATAHAVPEPDASDDVSHETEVETAATTASAPRGDATEPTSSEVSAVEDDATPDSQASSEDDIPPAEAAAGGLDSQSEGDEQPEADDESSPTDESPSYDAPERPIDVFFSAKSHLDTQRVSRGTSAPAARTTTSRRGRGTGRVEMPDVLGDRARRSPHSAGSSGSAPSAISAESSEAADSSKRPSEMTESPAEVTASQDSKEDVTDTASSTPSKGSSTSSSTPSRKKASTKKKPTTSAAVTSGKATAKTADSSPDGEAAASAQPSDVPRGTGESVDGAEFRSIPVESIVPNPRQPRQEFDEEDMSELVHSVREIGVLQPIVVRRVAEGQYELVMGERRWRASKAAERSEIPAIVRATDDIDLLRDALLENIHRSELNPLEEAAAYRQLLDDFQCTQDELAARIGRSRPQISNTLRLMKLPPGVQRRVAAGVLSSGHARALLGLSTQEQMEELAARIVAEGLSVRATEEAVTMMQQPQEESDVSREAATRLPSNTRYQQLDEYADALTDRLDTQVKITLGARKGRIAIDFGSIEDLHRLMEMIGQSQNT